MPTNEPPSVQLISVKEFLAGDAEAEAEEFFAPLRAVSRVAMPSSREMRARAKADAAKRFSMLAQHALPIRATSPDLWAKWKNEDIAFANRARMFGVSAPWLGYVDLPALHATRLRMAMYVANQVTGEKFMSRSLPNGDMRIWKLYTQGISASGCLPPEVDEATAIAAPREMLRLGLLVPQKRANNA